MANSFVRYTGNGSTTAYAISYSYRAASDLIVTINGVATTSYTLNSAGSTLTFDTAPANASSIEIRRKTSQTSRLTDYAAGSVLTENDLDTDSTQAFFMSQEAIDDASDVISLDNSDFQYNVGSKRLKNVSDPTSAQDAVTKNYLENTWLSSANKTALTTVASNIAAINTVNSSASVINTVNSNATNINTVATNITSVNTVATDIAKVIAVANDLAEAVSEVETVADDLNEATSEIDTVATNIANVNTVGLAIANVNTVAGLSSAITAVNGNSTNINTVAGNNTNINTVAGANSNITAVANIASDISAVENIKANVTTVAGMNTAINSVNSNSTNINAVAGATTNINNVGGAITNINTVATNLAAVNNFADVYRISSSAPTSSLNVGDLYFDTTANELKVYKSSGWAAAGSTVNGTSARFTYTISGTPTTVSGADANGNTLAYDAGFCDVYLNGVRLSGADITITSGTSIVFASALANGDLVDIVAYGTFNVASLSASNIDSGTVNSARLPTVPTTKGGTGLTSLGTAGQALVVNSGGNALEFSNASSAEVYGFNKYYNPSTLVKTVTVSSVGGSNKYFIDGVQQDTLDLYEGNTYIFNYPSAHPFKFSTTSNGTHASGSEYTTGVTHNSSTQVTIVVASGAPTLYYYCSSHSAMGGTANTPTPANNAVQYITTNQGQDNITESQYANFDDVLFSASGFVFSINTNGNLISTI